MLSVAVLIIGIDGWDKYTAPLIRQVQAFEPGACLVVIDNASQEPYPIAPWIHRTERLCYAAAINEAKRIAGPTDWTIVLSNDVRCKGPFIDHLQWYEDSVIGPKLMMNQGYEYIEGWCVAAPEAVWAATGGWDERFLVSSWEDCDFSVSAVEYGFRLERVPLPFDHLDQRQRFELPEYAGTDGRNNAYMIEKHGVPE
jgi:hypothetical protein